MKFKGVDIEELIQIMKKNEVNKIKLKNRNSSIELDMGSEKNGIQDNIKEKIVSSVVDQKVKKEPEMSPEKEEKKEKKEQEKSESDNNLYEIKSPLVGTFYRAPAPGAPPYKEKGDKVKPGDVVCIVEAMKNMNEIESEVEGIIKDVCVENANMVEYNQILFKIKEEK